MKKLLLTTAAVLCFAAPAFAQNTETTVPTKQNAYLAFRLGGNRMKINYNGAKVNKNSLSLSGAIGTKITSDVRAELEIMTYGNYEETEINGTDRFDYKRDAVNFSVNILKDFDVGTGADAGKIKPYIGGGLGFAVFHDELKYDFTAGIWHYWGYRKENNTVFSANVQAGLAFALTDAVFVDVNARYTYFDKYKFFDNTLKMENRAVNMTAGLRINF